jgi:hypothetical protein
MNKNIANALLFQLGWFACVLGGDFVAFTATLLVLVLHKLFFVNSRAEWYLIVIAGFIGLIVDNLIAMQGILVFESPSLFNIPVWLACIWVLFATTLNHSLAWLKNRYLAASALGAISAPMSYLAGSKLTAVTLAEPAMTSLMIIGACWAIMLPIFFFLLKKLQS